MSRAMDSTRPDDAAIVKGALLSGAINAVINGAIQIFLLPDTAAISLTVNKIDNDQHTVLGTAVPLAVSLAMILSVVTYTTLKAPKKPFLPTVLWLTLKHGIFAFGLMVAGAVVWQRVMGEIQVAPIAAAVILGGIAGIVAMIVNFMTIKASLLMPDRT